jgi:hypothetical protein
MNGVITHKRVLEQIAVSDWGGELADVLDDFHNPAQPGTGSC